MKKPRKVVPAALLTAATIASAIVLAAPAGAEAKLAQQKTAQQKAASKSAAKPNRKPAQKTPQKTKTAKSSAKKHLVAQTTVSNDPSRFVETRVQKVLADLKSRPLRPPMPMANPIDVSSSAAKSAFLGSLYERNFVEASWASEMLSDKLVMSRVLEKELGSRALVYFPKTIGLREFLAKHRLVKPDGTLVGDGDKIEQTLHDEFPGGFVVRPAVGVAPQETGKGMFKDGDEFIVELLKPNSPLYNPKHMQQPVVSHILETVASGEALVIQENIVGTADARKPLKTRYYQEVRVHTYEGRVVEGSVPDRWVQNVNLTDEQMKQAEAFVADFLRSLPLPLLNKQAWGIDIAVLDNGEMRVVDIVTNRGKKIQWSSYLEQPRVLGAYARHFETYYGLRFTGLSGTLLRNNFGNYFPYWEKRIEKAKPGFGKVLAFLPPIP